MTKQTQIRTIDAEVNFLSKELLSEIADSSNGAISYHESLSLDEGKQFILFHDLILQDESEIESVKPFIKTKKYVVVDEGLNIKKEFTGVQELELIEYYVFSNGVIFEVENLQLNSVAYVDSEESLNRFLTKISEKYTFLV